MHWTERERAVEHVGGDDAVRAAGRVRQVYELECGAEPGDRLMRPIAVAPWLNVLAQLDRQFRVRVEGLDALSVEASARLQLGCRGEVADHRPRADPLRIADPELPADRCAPAPRVARLCASWIANADARRGSTELITGKYGSQELSGYLAAWGMTVTDADSGRPRWR